MKYSDYKLRRGLRSSELVRVLVRLYVVSAKDLHPADFNGYSDPYLIVRLGKDHVFDDSANSKTKELNPTFGKYATFYRNSLLFSRIWIALITGIYTAHQMRDYPKRGATTPSPIQHAAKGLEDGRENGLKINFPLRFLYVNFKIFS